MTADGFSGNPTVPAKRPKGGRPAKVVLSEEQILEVAAMAARGLRDQDIAARLGFTDRTLRAIKKRDPRVQLAIDKGWSALHEELAGSLVARALDLKNPTGTTAAIFLLKARFSYRDGGDPPPPPDQARIRLEMLLPKALPLDRYRALYAKNGKPGSERIDDGNTIDAEVVGEGMTRA